MVWGGGHGLAAARSGCARALNRCCQELECNLIYDRGKESQCCLTCMRAGSTCRGRHAIRPRLEATLDITCSI